MKNSPPVKLLFSVNFLTETLIGEQPKVSQMLFPVLGLGKKDEGRKSVIQIRNVYQKPILRITSIKGLVRHAAEFIIEKIAESVLAKHRKQLPNDEGIAVCSYLNVSKSSHLPRCILPVKNLDGTVREKMEKLGWISTSGNKLIYRNYPCLSCSIFGTTGLKSLVNVFFMHVKSPQKPLSEAVVPTERKSFLFFHQLLQRGKVRPLILNLIRSGNLNDYVLGFAIRRPTIPHLHVKSDFDTVTVATSIIYLSTLVINSGLFRLGRFKSRGLGWIQLIPKNTDTLKEILKATSNNLVEAAKKVLEEELKSRLLT